MDNIINTVIKFRDSVLNKFGPVLGTIVLIFGALVALSVIGFLVKTLFKVVIGLIIVVLIVYGVYRLVEWFKSK